ncbi:MAG: XRE family transcriptional regulator [Parcubacteria group bacterium GW2011_GWC1_38_6]|nr:MAG: XRE family transcriptional regulator [Parcubacteria group bacterium GW2011_GWC1_38_6]
MASVMLLIIFRVVLLFSLVSCGILFLQRSFRYEHEHLAFSAKVDAGYLSRIENGRRNPPLPRIILKLATALDIDSVLLMMAAGYLKYDPVSNTKLTEEDIIIKIERSLMKKGT